MINHLARTSSRADRLMLAAAFAVTALWWAIYAAFSPDGLCDEPWHLGVMRHFWAKQQGWPESMPHLPGYHWLVLAVTSGPPTYAGARAVTAVCAIVALIAFAGAWRRIHTRSVGLGAATLSIALLPILQPFTAMAYTDVPALSLLLCAWWAQLAKQRAAAAALLAASCLIRQTSIVWSAFFISWELLEAWRRGERGRELVVSVGRRSAWLLALIIAAAGLIIRAGRFTPGTQPGNALEPNIANLHIAACLIALLGAPLWLSRMRQLPSSVPSSKRRSALLVAAGIGIAVLLATTYSNAHVWNQDVWWPEVSFTLLRNWPLVLLDLFPPLRFASGLLIVAVAFACWWQWRAQPRKIELAGVFVIGAALIASNNLVEPRYFITPAAFVLLFLGPDEARSRRLCLWFGILCAAHAPFILLGKSLW